MNAPEQGGEKPLRLTKDVIQALLNKNAGFKDSTYYSGKNFSEARQYEIVDGQLHIRSNSKTSWADSRQQQTYIADEAATRRFLSKNLSFLDTGGVADEAAALKAARKEAERIEKEAATTAATSTVASASNITGPPGSRRPPGSNQNVNRAITFAAAVCTAIWVAPHLKTAWVEKGRPRWDEWRNRHRSSSDTDPAEDSGHEDSLDGEESGPSAG